MAKLALNSFYGKFGQCSNMSEMAYITCYEKLYDFLTNQTKVIKDFHILDMDMVVMEYVQSEEFQEPDCKTNVIVTFMCSAYACLKLWRVMNQLGSRVMYHDTDSVIYSIYQGQWKPPTWVTWPMSWCVIRLDVQGAPWVTGLWNLSVAVLKIMLTN